MIYVEIADFNEEQMKNFVNNWFQDEKDLDKKCWQELSKDKNKPLQEMGHVPLLLGLLCLTYKDLLEFPHRRVEIYKEAIDVLLKRWDTSRQIKRDRPYENLSLGRKHQLLNELGANFFEEGKFLIRKEELANALEKHMQNLPDIKEDIDGEVIVRAVAAQHGLFVERARNLYSFAHLSFQEYFAAKHINENTLGKSLEGLLEYVTDDQWHEVFLNTSSLLIKNSADEFFELFLQAMKKLITLATSNKELKKLLEWANDKAEYACENLGKYKQQSLCAWYIYRAIDLTISLDPTFINFSISVL